jgi:bifunctional DNA-binding transcriptional regulator/antitoxin component of YhaV-PrlF toxin-antitoxin module
MNASHIGT